MDNKYIIKKLGNGMSGTVFLVSDGTTEYALKIEKIPEKYAKDYNKNILNLQSRDLREIEFSLNFANKYPEQFIYLYAYDIINNCDHIQEYTNNLNDYPNNIKNIYIEKKESKYCIRKIYSLVDTVLKQIINKLTHKQIYSFVAQISYIIYLMQKEGYTHNDLQTNNVGVINTNKEYIQILDFMIPLFGYQYLAIDFGMVLNDKYIMDDYEIEMHNDNKQNEITRVLKKLISFEPNEQIKKIIDSDKNLLLFNQFIKSDDYRLVKDFGTCYEDRFIIYQILFPTESQKMFFGAEYIRTYKPIYNCDKEDIIYFFNNKLDLLKIIKYCDKKLKI
jgi:hypothetical protein